MDKVSPGRYECGEWSINHASRNRWELWYGVTDKVRSGHNVGNYRTLVEAKAAWLAETKN